MDNSYYSVATGFVPFSSFSSYVMTLKSLGHYWVKQNQIYCMCIQINSLVITL